MNKTIKSFLTLLLVGMIVLGTVVLVDLYEKNNQSQTIDYSNLVANTQKPASSNQLRWNNLTLVDSTVQNFVDNTCSAYRFGMNITISPCVATTITGKNIEQSVKFEWNGITSKNISWIFVYDNDLESGKISALQNTSRTVKQNVNTFVNNFLVDKVISSVNLTYIPQICTLGNLNNTRFYNVTRTTGNSTYIQTICFTNITVVNATAFRISGNADILQDKVIYENKYVDVTNQIQFLGKGLLNDSRSYYKVNNVEFSPNEVIETKWIYTPVNKSGLGKWHILGYETSTGLVNAITSNQYIYIDPWWNNNYTYYRNINVSTDNVRRFQNLTTINITIDTQTPINQGKMRNDCADLEVIYNDSIESQRMIENCNSTTSQLVFNLKYNIEANSSDNNYNLYYGNPTDTVQNDNMWGSNIFIWADNFTSDDGKWQIAKAEACTTVGTGYTISGGILTNLGCSNPAGYSLYIYRNTTFRFDQGFQSKFGLIDTNGGYMSYELVSINTTNENIFLGFGPGQGDEVVGFTSTYIAFNGTLPVAEAAAITYSGNNFKFVFTLNRSAYIEYKYNQGSNASEPNATLKSIDLSAYPIIPYLQTVPQSNLAFNNHRNGEEWYNYTIRSNPLDNPTITIGTEIAGLGNTTTNVTVSPVSPIIYETTSIFNCTNNGNLYTELYINGINKTNEKGLSIVREAGNYTLNCTSYSEGLLLGSSDIINYTINSKLSNNSMFFKMNGANVSYNLSSDSPVFPTQIVYGIQTNVSGYCPSQLGCQMSRDLSTGISNPPLEDINILSAGNYTYELVALSSSDNYTYLGATSTYLNILPSNSSLAISVSPTSAITNGTQVNVSGSGCPDGSCILRRNGVIISNPDISVLVTGNYTYNYSFVGSQNYSSNSIIRTIIVNPVVFGGINGTIYFFNDNLSQILSFQVPFRFTTKAFMNLTGIQKVNNEYSTLGSSYEYENLSSTAKNFYVNFTIQNNSYNVSGTMRRAYINLGVQYNTTAYSLPLSCYQNRTTVSLLFNETAVIGGTSIRGLLCYNQTAWINLTTDIPWTSATQFALTPISNDTNWKDDNLTTCSTPTARVSSGMEKEQTYTSSYTFCGFALNWSYVSYPTNLNISISNKQVSFYSGIFNLINNKTQNFYAAVNSYLYTCNYIGINCILPITFNSSTPGILNYSNVLFDNIGYIEENKVFNPVVDESSTQTFQLNISYDYFYYSNAVVTLIYNGTSHSTTSSGSSFNRVFSSTFDIANETNPENRSFYWNILLYNGTTTESYNTSLSYQYVNPIRLFYCTTPYTNKVLNFTTYSSNGTLLNTTLEATFSYWTGTGAVKNEYNYELTSGTQNNYVFCLNSTTSTKYSTTVSYIAPGYDRREYIIDSGTLSSGSPQNIPLFLGSTADTDIITLVVKDQNYNPIKGSLISIQEWNIGTNTYSNVGMLTTNNNGEGIINLELYNVWYRAVITYNGNIVEVTDVQKLSSTTWEIQVNLNVDNPYQLFETISHGLVFNNATNITTFTWLDNNGYVNQGCLVIGNNTNFGYQTISSECISSVSGTINYLLPSNGDYQIYGIIYLNENYSVSQVTDVLYERLGTPTLVETVAPHAKVLSFLFVGTSAAVGIAAANPIWGTFLLIASLFISGKLGWLNGISTILWGLISIGIIVLFRLFKK